MIDLNINYVDIKNPFRKLPNLSEPTTLHSDIHVGEELLDEDYVCAGITTITNWIMNAYQYISQISIPIPNPLDYFKQTDQTDQTDQTEIEDETPVLLNKELKNKDEAENKESEPQYIEYEY